MLKHPVWREEKIRSLRIRPSKAKLLMLAALTAWVVAAGYTPASAAVIDLPATADTYVVAGDPTANYSNSDSLCAVVTPYQEVFLRFDLSSIPDGATLNAATLNLSVRNVSNNLGFWTPIYATCYRATTDSWTESGLTYANRPTDYSPGSVETFVYSGGGKTWELAPMWSNFADDLSDNNLSLMLTLSNSSTYSFAYFYSRESSAGGPSSLPSLTIDYTVVPEPSSGLMLGLASLLCVRCRRPVRPQGE